MCIFVPLSIDLNLIMVVLLRSSLISVSDNNFLDSEQEISFIRHEAFTTIYSPLHGLGFSYGQNLLSQVIVDEYGSPDSNYHNHHLFNYWKSR
ncbi:MAG: hypothetical protein ACW99Q_12430 [Candidatus Kariarchaeaceae archaeon]|jgi:hypothetical protein